MTDRVEPGVFWRVEDEGTQGRYVPGDGIRARNRTTIYLDPWGQRKEEELAWFLDNYLNEYCKEPSPLISTYESKIRAVNEAKRRKESGKAEVMIIKIDVRRLYGRITFRKASLLAYNLGVEIIPEAYGSAKHEFLFANHIPEDAIAEVPQCL